MLEVLLDTIDTNHFTYFNNITKHIFIRKEKIFKLTEVETIVGFFWGQISEIITTTTYTWKRDLFIGIDPLTITRDSYLQINHAHYRIYTATETITNPNYWVLRKPLGCPSLEAYDPLVDELALDFRFKRYQLYYRRIESLDLPYVIEQSAEYLPEIEEDL